MELIITTSIVCGSLLSMVLSTLTYFAKYHRSGEFTKVYQDLDKVNDRLSTAEDDLRKINNKMRFK